VVACVVRPLGHIGCINAPYVQGLGTSSSVCVVVMVGRCCCTCSRTGLVLGGVRAVADCVDRQACMEVDGGQESSKSAAVSTWPCYGLFWRLSPACMSVCGSRVSGCGVGNEPWAL
jgi:hypothetical protein